MLMDVVLCIRTVLLKLLLDAEPFRVFLHTLHVFMCPFIFQPRHQVAQTEDCQDAPFASELRFKFFNGARASLAFANLLAIERQDHADDFASSLADHLDSTTYSGSGRHDVVDDEHALSGDWNTN